MLTDGMENSPRCIADVAARSTRRTYAVGLGTPQNTSAAALQTISGNNGGFLLVTGAIGTDNRFLLQKYFLQILAGVSNAEVVLDPDGELVPGVVHRIPFQLTDADSGVDVVLLSPAAPKRGLPAADAQRLAPRAVARDWRAGDALRAGQRRQRYYRLALPTQLEPTASTRAAPGTRCSRIGSPRTKRTAGNEHGIDRSIVKGLFAPPARSSGRRIPSAHLVNEGRRRMDVAAADAKAAAGATVGVAARGRRGVPYSVAVHSYSSVGLQASLQQSAWEPGATVRLLASLSQGGAPLPASGGAAVWAEWKRPDGSMSTLNLADEGDGQFGASFVAASAGVHALRVRARGLSRGGHVFSRERSLTAAVWRGGDRDAEVGAGGGGSLVDALVERDARLCELLRCLLGTSGSNGALIEPALERRLREAGVDLDGLRRCLERYCRAAEPGKRTSD